MLQLHFAFAQQTPRAFPFILLQLFFLSFLCSAEVRSTWSVMKICVVKTVPAQLGQCRSCRSQLLSSKKTAFYFAVDTFFSPFPVFYCFFFFFFLLFLLHSPSALAKISGTTVQPQQALRPLRSLPLCICTWVEQLLFFLFFLFLHQCKSPASLSILIYAWPLRFSSCHFYLFVCFVRC